MKKLFTLFFALMASVGTIFAQSGTCGNNLTWNLTGDVLTIKGTGAMDDYNNSMNVPWYSYRSAITSVIIKNGVTSIGICAFNACSSMTSITIPNSVTSIGYAAFYGCRSLTSVSLPYGITSIEACAFYGCRGLTSITIPASVTSIGYAAFEKCTALTSVTIPNSVTSIEYEAFSDCTGLTSVTIPNSVTSIGHDAFCGCTGLTSVTISNSITSIETQTFAACDNLTSIEIPNSVTSIGNWAFSGCSNLTSVTIPNSVTNIGSTAFRYCRGLTSVTIPNSVTSIGDAAFEGCSGLTSITCEAVTPPMCGGSRVFYDVDKSIPLYVPAQSITAYQAANVWRDFTNILPIEGDEPTGNECSDSKILAWEPVEQQAYMDRWYRFQTSEESDNPIYGSFTPIIPDTCDLRIKINNLSDENANVHADVYFECSEPALKAKSYMISPYESDSFDIDRDLLEVMGWADMLLNIYSDQNISIKAELIPKAPRDILQDTIVAYVCWGDTYFDTISYIDYVIESSITWIDTVQFRDGLQMKDSITLFFVHPLVMPEPLSAEEMRGIGAAPLLVQGMQLFVDESNAALTEYYRNLGNSVDTITHIDTAYWAKPVYKANGSLDIKKEAPLDLSKYYSKNEYMDTLLLVVKGEECYTTMRIEYIFPIEEYKYVFRNDTICPPGPYYNPDTLTSIVLDTLALPRMVDTITTYYSMLQPALYSQDEISILPLVTNGQPIDTSYTISSLKMQFAADATDLTARVTNIKWQVLAGNTWMDMPYVVPETATEIHMRYIVETECAIRDTCMNIILPLTPEPCLIASGTCGNNLTWTLTCDSVLTISGTGDMTDWQDTYYTPWYDIRFSVKQIVIEEGVTSIGKWAFGNCINVSSVTIPNGVTRIADWAFGGCQMETLEIPNSVVSIGEYAFYTCESLKNLTLSSNLLSIGQYAFCYCYNLTSIELPNKLTTLDEGAFRYCSGLSSVTIPNSVTSIGIRVFGSCSGLNSIIVASNNSNYSSEDGVLFNKDKTTLLQFPGAKIGSYAIPQGVTNVAQEAFMGSSLLLTSIVIPSSVASIGERAFYDCVYFASITCEAVTPPTCGEEVFFEVDKSACTLYVPAGSVAAYQAAEGWRDFFNILAISSTEEPDVLSIAEAIEIGMALDSMATSEEIYTIEGYVINAGTFSYIYNCQNWYMADTPNASSSIFQAYRCFAINGTDTMAVQNGEKVRMTGHLQKYYKLSTASYVVEMSQTPATILSRPTIDTITVAQALEIGAGLEINSSTSKQYVIRGYVSSITSAFDEQYGHQNFYITDDAASTANSNAQGGFYVYRGVPSTGTSIEKGTFVEITCAIKNYQNIYIENSDHPIAVKVLQEAPEPCLIASGTCGDNLTWELGCDSVLTISGTGAMWSGEENMGWRQYLSSIRTVILPDGLTAIAPQAFYNCVNLQSVNVPNSVHAIGHKAFVGCESLTEPVYNATIFAFMPRNYCGAYSIPEGIVSVAAYAFCGIASDSCIGLTEITIPSSVERLGTESLGAFGLGKITCFAVTPPVCDANTFFWYMEDFGVTLTVNKSIPVYVPAESVAAYQTADVWKEFFNILPIEGTIEPQDSIYNVVYLDQEGLQIETEPIILHLPVAPVIEGFTFLKWQVVAGDLEQGIYIQAVYTADDPTNAPAVYTNPANKAQKLIRNGQVYILTDDKIYSVTGQKVK